MCGCMTHRLLDCSLYCVLSLLRCEIIASLRTLQIYHLLLYNADDNVTLMKIVQLEAGFCFKT
jgi:hypothetical protein